MKKLPMKILIAQDAIKSDKISEEARGEYRGLIDGFFDQHSKGLEILSESEEYTDGVWEGMFLKHRS